MVPVAFSDDQRVGLNIALHEAQLLGFEVDPSQRMAAGTFLVFTLPVDGPVPADRRVQLLFYPVGRVAARYLRASEPGAPWQTVVFGIDDVAHNNPWARTPIDSRMEVLRRP